MRTFMLAVFLALALSLQAQEENARAYLDYSQVDFSHGAVVTLRGNVELYWHELLTSNDFRRERHNKPLKARIPASWTALETGGHFLPAHGFATYRWAIIVPRLDNGLEYCLYLPLQYSAYRISVNGEQLAEIGKVANNPNDTKASPHSLTVPIRTKTRSTDTLDVVLQVANFAFPQAGLVAPIQFGAYSKVANQNLTSLSLRTLTIGALLLFILVGMLLYRTRRDDQSPLWLAVAALFSAIRIAVGETDLVTYWSPWLSWSVYHKFLYVSSIGAVMALFLFVHCRYQKQIKNIYAHILMSLGVLLCLFIVFMPVALFTSWRGLVYAYILILFVIALVRILGFSLKEKGVFRVAFAVLLLLACMLLDTLQYWFRFESTFSYITLGTALFLLLMSSVMVRDFTAIARANVAFRSQVRTERNELEQKIKLLTEGYEQLKQSFATEQLEQRQQVWVDSGIAMLSTLMAQNQNLLAQLCEQTLARLTKYLRVNAAILYVAGLDLQSGTMKLYMKASFGLTREQKDKYNVLDEDQGLVGACYRDNTFQHLANLPDDFIKVTSGLGQCTPPAILLMPLQSTAGVVGVLELGRFEDFQEFEITFVKRIAVILANNLIHTKNNEDYILAIENLREEIKELKQQIENQNNYKEQLEAELEAFRREI